MGDERNSSHTQPSKPALRPDADHPSSRRLSLRILAAFVLTFIAARVIVLLIMLRMIPDLFLYVGETHVHHLNYGIFLLSGVGAYLIFRRPSGQHLLTTAGVFGVGLGLTFDEFGMWFHLGGGYWQRASFDAVVVVAALLGLIAAAPSMKQLGSRHWTVIAILICAISVFVLLLIRSLRMAERKFEPRLMQLDQHAPR